MENASETGAEVRDNEAAEVPAATTRASRLPLTLVIVSLLLWFGFQTAELIVERGNLSSFKGSLDGAMQETQKVRAQFESLVTKTADLANKGNASAKAAVDELEKRGIPIKSAGPSAK